MYKMDTFYYGRNTNMRRGEFSKTAGRIILVLLCLGGFTFQTLLFLLLYWTYPTVVDIQKSSPTYLDIPAITICNPIGYNYTSMCKEFGEHFCIGPRLLRYAETYICLQHDNACKDGRLPKDFTVIDFRKFMKKLGNISYESHDKLRADLESYTECSIEYEGTQTDCNLEHVMGSFFTKDELPQYCYTLYSMWGNPYKKRERIPKGSIIKFHFQLNASKREHPDPKTGEWLPTFNTPTTPYMQIAVHNPYFLPSPYKDGSMFSGGRSYELKVMMEETHLLQSPYQTNCTDYMKMWKKNAGKGPINQVGIVQKCRADMFNKLWECVPLHVDYPHTYSVCRNDFKNITVPVEECTNLLYRYNQPCDSISYEITKEEVEMTILKELRSQFLPETYTVLDCSGRKVWRPECSIIDIDILFDKFEITNLTYNPKIESLDMFNSISGYVGMWLGIYLVIIYDFIGTLPVVIKTWMVKKRRKSVLLRKTDPYYMDAEDKSKLYQLQLFHKTICNW